MAAAKKASAKKASSKKKSAAAADKPTAKDGTKRGRPSHVDWEQVYREVRANQLSLKEIARQHGISDTAIRNRAKRYGWERDLSSEVRQGVRAKLARDAAEARQPTSDPKKDKEIVDDAAERGANVVREHQTRLKRLAGLCDQVETHLTGWLSSHAGGSSSEDQDPGKQRSPGSAAACLFVGKGDGVASMLQALTSSTERLVKLERQAYNLDEEGQSEANDLESRLERGAERARRAGAPSQR